MTRILLFALTLCWHLIILTTLKPLTIAVNHTRNRKQNRVNFVLDLMIAHSRRDLALLNYHSKVCGQSFFFFLKKCIHVFSKDTLNSKVTVKGFMILQRFLFLIITVLFNFVHQKPHMELAFTGIYHILKCIWYFNCISQYYCFYCVFDQINSAFVGIRDFFQKSYWRQSFEW